MSLLIIFLATPFLLVAFVALWYLKNVHPFASKLKEMPRVEPTNFFLGSTIVFYQALKDGLDFSQLLLNLTYCFVEIYERERIYMFWLGWQPIVVLFKPETIEAILSNQSELTKSDNYEYLHPWLGTGLLTSTGKKWRSRRKLLTPAFHFRILDDFIPIVNEQSKVLVKRLSQTSYLDDIVPYITTCTLDIICETAMGTKINAQQNPKSEYVEAIYFLGESFMQRQINWYMWWTPIFKLTTYGKRYYRSLDTLHCFTRKVIQERKAERMLHFKDESNNEDSNAFLKSDGMGIKKRQAFLDLLIQYQLNGAGLTDEDIREEVDTFMFEGHDTTSMALCWAIYLIGLDKKVQIKVHEELDLIFGDDTERPITAEDLANLKYLECCIKEALRLFPSVPVVARTLENSIKIHGYELPKGTSVSIILNMLHRDKTNFPNPERFDPERFTPENSLGRSPFAYIPFSAGPRNCIGQKFAMMEEKIVLAQVFRHFRLEAMDTRDAVPIAMELVVRPKEPLRFRIRKRN